MVPDTRIEEQCIARFANDADGAGHLVLGHAVAVAEACVSRRRARVQHLRAWDNRPEHTLRRS